MFTGLFDLKKPGEYPYLTMDGGGEELSHGRPPAGRMRREIAFWDLPEDVREAVLRFYREFWGL